MIPGSVIWARLAGMIMMPVPTNSAVHILHRQMWNMLMAAEIACSTYHSQWVCFEVEMNAVEGVNRFFIWTQDGTFNGFYNSITNDKNSSDHLTAIDVLGLYVNTGQSGSCWTGIDELILSTGSIGPPSRFNSNSQVGNDTDNGSNSGGCLVRTLFQPFCKIGNVRKPVSESYHTLGN